MTADELRRCAAMLRSFASCVAEDRRAFTCTDAEVRDMVRLVDAEAVATAQATAGDAEALGEIAALLDGREWSAGDLEDVAEIVQGTGRTIGPPR